MPTYSTHDFEERSPADSWSIITPAANGRHSKGMTTRSIVSSSQSVIEMAAMEMNERDWLTG
jgi:hypothetical protein